MSDPSHTGQPTDEELRAYMEQLREAEAAEIVAQAFSMLASAAQVKLGRKDARVLIDSLAGLLQSIEGSLEPQLAAGMRSAVGQLQMAQVQAEREEAAAKGSPADAAPGAAAPQAAPEQRQAADASEADQRLTDRLWIPGRDQPPPA